MKLCENVGETTTNDKPEMALYSLFGMNQVPGSPEIPN